MYSASEKQRQLKQTALRRAVEAGKANENYQRDLAQIQRNGQEKSWQRTQQQRDQQDTAEQQQQRQRLADDRLRAEREAAKDRELYEAQQRCINEEKLRQHLRDSSQVIRELKSKLRAAYVAKGVAAQLMEAEVLRNAERLVARQEQEQLERARQENVDHMRRMAELAEREKRELRGVLLGQMEDARDRKRCLYEEFLREKLALDEVVRRIQAEHLEDIERKLERQQRTRREMEFFREAKQTWQARQSLATSEENERIRQYCEARDRQVDEERNRKAKESAVRAKKNQRMVATLEAEIEEQRKRELLLQDLYAAEQDEREETKVQRALEQQLRKRIETRLALERQRIEIGCRREQEAAEERQFRESQLQQWAERDRLELLSDARRRQKLLEHRRAVQELLDDRRRRQADTVKQLMHEENLREQDERRRQEILEEERIKLLREHAAALLGFLPPGVLRESDREFIPLPRAEKSADND